MHKVVSYVRDCGRARRAAATAVFDPGAETLVKLQTTVRSPQHYRTGDGRDRLVSPASTPTGGPLCLGKDWFVAQIKCAAELPRWLHRYNLAPASWRYQINTTDRPLGIHDY